MHEVLARYMGFRPMTLVESKVVRKVFFGFFESICVLYHVRKVTREVVNKVFECPNQGGKHPLLICRDVLHTWFSTRMATEQLPAIQGVEISSLNGRPDKTAPPLWRVVVQWLNYQPHLGVVQSISKTGIRNQVALWRWGVARDFKSEDPRADRKSKKNTNIERRLWPMINCHDFWVSVTALERLQPWSTW